MKLVFYSIILNHHQAPVADEFFKLLGDKYCFVELARVDACKGSSEDYSTRPYLLRSWETPENYRKAMELASTAEVCVFSGFEALPFLKVRMKKGLLSFDMGERWMKKGLKNLLSPRIQKMLVAYYWGRWDKKPLYKLCASAFTAIDQNRLRTYHEKCYKWGYFTSVEDVDVIKPSRSSIVSMMWCARFIDWKHPELPIQMAIKLRDKGYKFIIDYYGEGDKEESMRQLVEEYNLQENVIFHGAQPNYRILEAMENHSIFLLTSNRNEGWGVVANESMSKGCVIVASDAIGSAPYLVKDGENGFLFKSGDVDSLTEKVEWLLNHPDQMIQMQENAYNSMRDVWNPRCAADNLLRLISDLQEGRDVSIVEGPCSKA